MTTNNRTQLNVTQLEGRDLPAAVLSASLISGVLKLEGTSGNDTIIIRETSGPTGESISIDGCKIAVNGQLRSAVSASAVGRVEVRALGGNDRVSLHASAYEAVSVAASLWGGSGNDVLIGGEGADTIYGNAGWDTLSGYGGDDFLYGGTAGIEGATVAEKDKFFGGAGFDRYNDAFNLSQWLYNGASISDVNQQDSPTCQTLAALAAAVRAGIGFGGPKITALGNNYSVKLYDNGNPVYETVRFDGTWSDYDPAPSVDAGGYSNPEFWTILMQRARMERFYGVDWARKMTSADWDAVNAAKGGTLYSTATAIRQLYGWQANWSSIGSVSAQGLATALSQGQLVIASSLNDAKQISTATGVVSKHAYAVTSVYKTSTGAWQVRLYNPWGEDGNGLPRDGVNDGYVTLSWTEFRANFDGVTFAKRY